MSYSETVNGKIISAIVKWGAVTHKDLYLYLKLESKISTFTTRTNTLVRKKVIKSVKLPNQKKAIIYAFEGTKLLAGDDIRLTPNNQLSHDSVVSFICIRLLQMSKVYDVNTVKQEELTNKLSLVPDADALVMAGDDVIHVAIEYEATQKSKNRIVQKYYSYSQSNDYKYVFYFFDFEKTALIYAKTIHDLANSKLNQHASLKIEKFYFFVRSDNAQDGDFFKLFRLFYPHKDNTIMEILNGSN